MDERDGRTRRRFLAASAGAAAALAGCGGVDIGGENGGDATPGPGGTPGRVTLADFRGSGLPVASRPAIEGPRIEDLPDLSGELLIYLGGGEGGLYLDLLDLFSRIYPDFEPFTRTAPSSQLANTIIEETRGGASPADVFWAVDAGSLGVVADHGATITLPGAVVEPVPESFHPDDQWVGVAGRARSVPYNTEQLSAGDVPTDVSAFPEFAAETGMGWAPTYGAFQAFVTAMRVLEGRRTTRRWLRGMLEAGVSEYPDEFLVSNAVADGEIGAGFANHYYAIRVQAARPEAPIDLAFTADDAGALVNVAGVAIIEGTEREDLATTFARHLLTVEAQEFFATRTFAYPMLPGVPPVGGLPRVDELDPPELDLAKLSDLQPTLELMREVGVL